MKQILPIIIAIGFLAAVLQPAGGAEESAVLGVSTTTIAAESPETIARDFSLFSFLRGPTAIPTVAGASTDAADPAATEIPFFIETISAQNITQSGATIRGRLSLPANTSGDGFFVLSHKHSAVDSFLHRSGADNAVQIFSITPRTGEEIYQQTVRNLVGDITYYTRLCFSPDQNTTAICGQTVSFTTDTAHTRESDKSRPTVRTLQADTIEAHSARVGGDVNMRDFIGGTVFVVYGTDADRVETIEQRFSEYRDLPRNGDRFNRERITTQAFGSAEYVATLDDLDSNTTYTYTLCVESGEDDEEIDCGFTRSFTTDRRDLDSPTVTAKNATGVSLGNATLRGYVDMQDFNNGLTFFVYGTNESSVAEIPNRYSEYLDIRQSGDALQRVVVDNDLDSDDNQSLTVFDLSISNTYFHRMCVQYEDTDDDGDEVFLLQCGQVRSFVAL